MTDASIPIIIDEYHWVTITNKVKPPDKNTLKKWLNWKQFNTEILI